MHLNFHPAPGIGELPPGFFVVPQNPIQAASQGVGRVPHIGELMPGAFAVPQNPLLASIATVGKSGASTAPPVTGGPVGGPNGGAGGGMCCGGGCGMGALDFDLGYVTLPVVGTVELSTVLLTGAAIWILSRAMSGGRRAATAARAYAHRTFKRGAAATA